MINVLQRLAELDGQDSQVAQARPTVSPDAAVEAIQKSLSEELSVDSLKYLSGVRDTIAECGMMPGMSGMPSQAPASFSINASAPTGDEVASMLTQIMTLAGAHKVGPEHMPPVDNGSGPSLDKPVDGHDDMKKMLSMFDDPNPEDEGAIGGGVGAGLGALAAGPLGALAGGAMGGSLEDSAGEGPLPDPELDGMGGALAGAAIHGDADGAIDGYNQAKEESEGLDNAPTDPTKTAAPDFNRFAYQPNVGGTGGDRLDGTSPKGNVTAEDVTAQLFRDYQRFVTESSK